MKIFILIYFIFSFVNASGQEKNGEIFFLEKIIKTWDKVSQFDDEYLPSIDDSTNKENVGDSLVKYNTILASLLSNYKFLNLKNLDLKKIIDSTSIKISISKDDKLKVVSWKIFTALPEPSCSNILFIKDEKIQIISLNGTVDDDFGNNVQFDTIIDVLLKNKIFYVLKGANKCGNFCVEKLASLYSISGYHAIKCKRAFLDGANYLSDLQFRYSLAAEKEPVFYIKGSVITSPVLDRDQIKVISHKRYRIVGCSSGYP